ncbi:MAG: Sapep family Mn(2+)-dependent dipeptidase [Treponema sp.]|jgi:succinyl-diaminopimelate desuccinylase|nr:Sapep family Mn(2+)-dependent dipeptidase [Treponema sp.]
MGKDSDQKFLGELEEWTRAHRDELAADVISLVNIRSVKEPPREHEPFGPGPARAIDRGVELGKKYGYETENDDYFTLSFLRKGKTEKELGILGHIDVVPEGNGWTFEPYQGLIRDGYIIGRGSGDDKGPSVAALYTLRALDDLKVELNHGIRVIWGANEESGMEDVKHYLKTHTRFPDFTIICDGEFPVCIGEKATLSGDLVFDIGEDSNLLDFYGGVAGNAVPDRAFLTIKADLEQVKTSLAGTDAEISGRDGEVKIEVRGIAGHAAHPEGTVNAIQKLAAHVSAGQLLTGKARGAVQFIAEAFADYYGAGLGIAHEDEVFGKTTHIGGMIRFEGGRLRQNFNSRVATRGDPADLLPGLYALAEKHHFVTENIRHGLSRYNAPDSPPIQVLVKTARQFLGEDLKPPYTTGGGTHAKYFPNAVPFGAKIPEPEGAPKKYGSEHEADEGIPLEDLLQAVKIYTVALIRLDELYR